jgi:hypothetical protein
VALYRLQWFIWFWWKFHTNHVASTYLATNEHDPHHPSFPKERAVFVVIKHGLHQSRLKVVKLDTRVPEASDFHDGAGTNVQLCVGWKSQEVKTTGRDIFTHVPGGHTKASRA